MSMSTRELVAVGWIAHWVYCTYSNLERNVGSRESRIGNRESAQGLALNVQRHIDHLTSLRCPVSTSRAPQFSLGLLQLLGTLKSSVNNVCESKPHALRSLRICTTGSLTSIHVAYCPCAVSFHAKHVRESH